MLRVTTERFYTLPPSYYYIYISPYTHNKGVTNTTKNNRHLHRGFATKVILFFELSTILYIIFSYSNSAKL